jgi:SapC
MADPLPPEQTGLPLFYKSVAPLGAQIHQKFALSERIKHPFAATAHAVPITVDEFAIAQRFYPILFGTGPNAAPLALLGLREGQNMFCDADGNWKDGVYVPAYIRRYPFLLARLTPDAKELSLCFDDQSGYVTEQAEGNLFAGDKPSDVTQAVLKFCEQFEIAIQRTRQFMRELNELKLLQEGEAQIQMGGPPMTFRGFSMIPEQAVQKLRAEQAKKMVKNGMLGLIYAHLFSLGNMQTIYQGGAEQPANAA